MTGKKDYECSSEQCARNDKCYCIDFHGGRLPTAIFRFANITRKNGRIETILSASTIAWIMSTLWLARVLAF
jgi:hypothetical protein